MQYLGHTYTKKNLLFTWNANLTRHPIVLFAKSGNTSTQRVSAAHHPSSLNLNQEELDLNQDPAGTQKCSAECTLALPKSQPGGILESFAEL